MSDEIQQGPGQPGGSEASVERLRGLYEQWRSSAGAYGKAVGKNPERESAFSSTSGFETLELAGPWSGPDLVGPGLVPGQQAESEERVGTSPTPTMTEGESREGTSPTPTGYEESLGFPGEYPFTRGVQPNMYRGRFWTMRQYAGFSTAEETNARYHFLLKSGQTGLSVAFDLPTQMGYDSSHSMALGEVGKVGVAIDTVDDMRTLFKGINLADVTTSMTINAPAVILLLMYQLVGEEQGAKPEQLGGTIQNDILKEYMARGTYIFPPAPSMRLTVDSFRYCSQTMPEWNMISISGYHIREAGCSAAQEIAFTLADGIEYAQQALDAGLDVDAFAGRLSFFFNAHNNFLEEVAKFRAARRLWARIMRERFKAKNPRSWMLRFHTQTAGSMLTAQQPHNNIVRTALQALASVLGGTQSLHTNGYDEALALPTEAAAEIALRTQQIIAHESGVCDTVDPLGGSWYLEDLTDKLEAAALDYIRKIDDMGGMLAAVERGYPQAEIQQQAYDWQRSVESGRRVIVGVNKFANPDEKPVPVNRDNAAEASQKARLAEYLERRDAGRVDACVGQVQARLHPTEALSKLGELAASNARFGYCEAILECLRSGATEGEIVSAMESVWGRHRPAM